MFDLEENINIGENIKVVGVGGGHRDVEVDRRLGGDELVDEPLKVLRQPLLLGRHRSRGVHHPEDVHLAHRELLEQVALVRDVDPEVVGSAGVVGEHRRRAGLDLGNAGHHREVLVDSVGLHTPVLTRERRQREQRDQQRPDGDDSLCSGEQGVLA